MDRLNPEDDELRAREAALTLAETSAGIGVWDVDLTNGMARGTPQFFRIHGLEPSAEPVPLDRVRALRHPEDRDRVIAGFHDAMASGADSYEMEYRIVRPDGEVRWIFGRGRVVRDRSGKPVRYSGVDLDITERKETAAALAAAKRELERLNEELEARVRERTAQLEAEAKRRMETEARLRQAQKMEAVGQLTGGVAHDFNNILQVIMGNLELLKRSLARAPGTEKRRDSWSTPIDTALRAARNAAQLTHRLLAFSRQQPLEPDVLDVNELIGEMSQMIHHTLGETIEVKTRLEARLWPAFTDRNQLQTALLNLVVNARDAMPEGGRLLVETQNVQFAEPYPGPIEDIQPGQYVLLSVTDTGAGIRKEHLDKVFEPFFTTKDAGKGSGLGLSMVYGFVKQSGGHARIYSEVGRGTSVKLYLPKSQVERGPARPARESNGGPPRAREGETILMVEDDKEVRRYVASALEGLGYRVLQAADGRAALALLDSSTAQRVDLLFTDVVLPGGMSGRALADAVRSRRAGLPILFTSGYTRDAVLHNGRLDDDVQLLSKPHDLDHLAAQVRAAIDRTP